MVKKVLKIVSFLLMIVTITVLCEVAYMQCEEYDGLVAKVEKISNKASNVELDVKYLQAYSDLKQLRNEKHQEYEEMKKIMWPKEESYLDSLCVSEELRAVDLGLSVKWANINIGASCPIGKGAQCSWTDTTLNQEGCSWGYDNGFLEDTIDSLKHLKPRYDIATRVCGGKWRMPTKEEFEELITKCSIVFDTISLPFHSPDFGGEYGYIVRFTGPSGMSIEMPLVNSTKQHFYSSSDVFPGSYWTSTYNDYYVECDEGPCNHSGLEYCPFYFSSFYKSKCESELGIDSDIDYGEPGAEMSIRPVCDK